MIFQVKITLFFSFPHILRCHAQVRKALGMPKKPLSSFGLFVSEKFADRGDESVPVST